MNFIYLRAFYAVASERSFTRGAQVLNVSQSTLSSQVKALEESYDVRLLDRRGRNVVPTDTGEALVNLCRDLFRQQDAIADLLSQSQKLQAGKLSIGADGPRHVLPVLKAFMDLHPNMHISLRTGNAKRVAQDLLDYETDVAVVAVDTVAHAQLYLEPFIRYELIAFVPKSHEFATRSVIDIEDFNQQKLIIREPTSRTRRQLTKVFNRAGVQPAQIIEIDSREATREAVAAGMGISVMSEIECLNDDPRCVAVKINHPDLQITEYVACLNSRKQTRSIREFFRLARMYRTYEDSQKDHTT